MMQCSKYSIWGKGLNGMLPTRTMSVRVETLLAMQTFFKIIFMQ